MSGREKSINIAIIAMGGQGGGVLSKWILDLAESQGYLAQYTSVPGVAQRTGSTIYYLELFPVHLADERGKPPVFALSPVPGDIDVLIASEMIEAGRALMRDFVGAGTVFIASDHRDYTIDEKQQMGDGRRPVEEIKKTAEKAAKAFICFDMDGAARAAGSVISSVLFGALAGSGALPFRRQDFKDAIHGSGKAVEANLSGFALGFERAGGDTTSPKDREAPADAPTTDAETPAARLLASVRADLPAAAQPFASEGVRAALDYQDERYALLYLSRLRAVHHVDASQGGARRSWALTRATARYLALAMTYEDVIRVADLKTRAARFTDFRETVRAEPNQIVNVSEYMHPRLQELCEILPASLGRWLLGSKTVQRLFGKLFSKGRRITTTKLPGFVMLFILGRLRWLRPRSLRMMLEAERIETWLSEIETSATRDYDTAVELAGLQRLIKGYGDTHERGLRSYQRILSAYRQAAPGTLNAATLKQLKDAALQDEDGKALAAALQDAA